jgi:hypothetical protein
MQLSFKIANLRPFKAPYRGKSGKYTCKTLKTPYFRAYKNGNKAFIYGDFIKITLKLSIRIKLAKSRTRINTAFLERQNRAKLAQFTKKCSQVAKIKQTLYLSGIVAKGAVFLNAVKNLCVSNLCLNGKLRLFANTVQSDKQERRLSEERLLQRRISALTTYFLLSFVPQHCRKNGFKISLTLYKK